MRLAANSPDGSQLLPSCKRGKDSGESPVRDGAPGLRGSLQAGNERRRTRDERYRSFRSLWEKLRGATGARKLLLYILYVHVRQFTGRSSRLCHASVTVTQGVCVCVLLGGMSCGDAAVLRVGVKVSQVKETQERPQYLFGPSLS